MIRRPVRAPVAVHLTALSQNAASGSLSGGRGADSRDRFKKRNGPNAECVRQFDDVDQTDIPFAAFDSADVISVQVR